MSGVRCHCNSCLESMQLPFCACCNVVVAERCGSATLCRLLLGAYEYVFAFGSLPHHSPARPSRPMVPVPKPASQGLVASPNSSAVDLTPACTSSALSCGANSGCQHRAGHRLTEQGSAVALSRGSKSFLITPTLSGSCGTCDGGHTIHKDIATFTPPLDAVTLAK